MYRFTSPYCLLSFETDQAYAPAQVNRKSSSEHLRLSTTSPNTRFFSPSNLLSLSLPALIHLCISSKRFCATALCLSVYFWRCRLLSFLFVCYLYTLPVVVSPFQSRFVSASTCLIFGFQILHFRDERALLPASIRAQVAPRSRSSPHRCLLPSTETSTLFFRMATELYSPYSSEVVGLVAFNSALGIGFQLPHAGSQSLRSTIAVHTD